MYFLIYASTLYPALRYSLSVQQYFNKFTLCVKEPLVLNGCGNTVVCFNFFFFFLIISCASEIFARQRENCVHRHAIFPCFQEAPAISTGALNTWEACRNVCMAFVRVSCRVVSGERRATDTRRHLTLQTKSRQ